MSFSQQIKTEIANTRIPQDKTILEIEVLGYILSNVKDLDCNMHFQNENKDVILRYTYILKNVLEFIIVEDDNINKKTRKKIQYILDIINIEDYTKKINGLKKLTINNPNEKIAFLRGIFLGGGYVLNPSDNYHLELVVNCIKTANMVKQYINDLNINCNIAKRKSYHVIYCKDGDSISELLILLGASVGLIKFEQTRVMKEMNNNINRAINCETGNLNKIMKSSSFQIEDIYFLKSSNKFQLLSQNLQDICNIRLDNPEYSLMDIAQQLGISKSGVNNRFKRIHKIVEEIKEGKKYEGI